MANATRGLFIAGNWKMFKTNTEARQFVLELAQNNPTPFPISNKPVFT